MRFCGGCGSPLVAAADQPRDSAQRRHMTVMFCDLVGSTRLAEELDPEDLRDVFIDYRGVCTREIARCGGYTANYMGDGVLVYFGYPQAHEDDPRRAVRAGLGILEGIADLNRQLEARFGISVRGRIGVHTGLVVAAEMEAGVVGEKYAIVGETPNIAARLESAAEPGSIAISEATQRLIAGYVETESLGQLPLKGVSRPIEVFRVVRDTGAVNRLDVAGPGRLTPLVGRGDELDRLLDRWQMAAMGQGGAVHISGPAGIGKSRVARALHERLAAVGHTLQVWQCSAYHQSSALHPVIEHLESRLQLDRTAALEEQRRVLWKAVSDAGADPTTAVALLANLLSIPDGAPSGETVLAPVDARAATLSLLEELLITNGANHPSLLVVEDLHWASPTTLDFLARIVATIQSLPVLAVFTFRPGFEPPWASEPGIVDLELSALSPVEVSALVRAAGRGTTLPPELVARVVESADGIPLFVEEMVKMLGVSATGDAPRNDLVDLTRHHVAVPPTLQGLLTARLDQLPEVREITQIAAVLGREFSLDLLGELCALDTASVKDAVQRMVDEDVVRPIGRRGRGRYQFRHALLREVAYASLLKRRRQEHHAKAADAIANRFSSLAAREPEVVAHHYTEAGAPAQALHYWRSAGVRALSGAAFLEAADHFRRGLDAVEQTPPSVDRDRQEVEFLSHLAASLQAGRGYAAPGVGDLYARARATGEKLGDETQLLFLIRGEWMYHLLRADYHAALKLAQQMMRLGRQRGDRATRVEAHLYLGLVYLFTAQFEIARSHLEDAIVLYERPDRPDQIYEALGDSGAGAMAYLATVLWTLGYDDESLERSDQSLRLAGEVATPMTNAQAWGMRAMLHLARKEPALTAQWVEKTVEFATDRSIPYWLNLSSLLDGWIRARVSRTREGLERFRDSLEAYLATGAKLGLPDFTLLLADLCRVNGDPAGGLDAIHQAEIHIEATGERYSESDLLRAKAELLLALEEPDVAAAEAALQRSIAVAKAQRARLPELRATAALAKLQFKLGDFAPVRDALEDVCAWFPSTSEIADVREVRALLVQLDSAGRRPEAR
jgi:class 3 adenylate cyclase/predicted ATPase